MWRGRDPGECATPDPQTSGVVVLEDKATDGECFFCVQSNIM